MKLLQSLIDEWHPTKNEKLEPNDFSCGSHQAVWWRCSASEDHEWKATINSRSQGRGCPAALEEKL